jgi:transposase
MSKNIILKYWKMKMASVIRQKISGCFKSLEGANIFCRVRSYLLSAKKHGISPTDALQTLFQGKLPDFCLE